MNDEEREEREAKVLLASSMDDRVASEEWVRHLERTRPDLVGQLGRPPTRKERRHWTRMAEKHKMDLMAAKIRYLRSGFKVHMMRYLEIRMRCGYVEGVPIPRWLMKAGAP